MRTTCWLAALPFWRKRSLANWVFKRKKRSRPADKHLLYHELLSAVQRQECPLCHLVLAASQKRLAYLFHEEVNDPPTRYALRASLGFCARHAASCVQVGHALGVAILYKDIVEQVQARLLQAQKQGWRALNAAQCPECLEEQHDEERFSRALAASLTEPEMQEAYKRGQGLCLLHLRSVLRHTTPEGLHPLQMAEQRRLQELKEDLDEFVRKNDYRFSQEPMGRERDSWLRALQKVTGKLRKD